MKRPHISSLFRSDSSSSQKQLPDMSEVIETPGAEALREIMADRMRQSTPGDEARLGPEKWNLTLEDNTRLVYTMHTRDIHTPVDYALALVDAEDPQQAQELAEQLMQRYDNYVKRAVEYSREHL